MKEINPKAWCIENGKTTAEFIQLIRSLGAPKYSKITHCMASNPEYGVTLRSCVAAHVRGNTENRTKPHRFTFRLLDADSAKFNAARAYFGHTKQEASEYAAKLYIEKAAREMAVSVGGKTKESKDSI